MAQKDTRVPIAFRVPQYVKKALEKEAKRGKLTVGEVAEQVLIDYCRWLEDQEDK